MIKTIDESPRLRSLHASQARRHRVAARWWVSDNAEQRRASTSKLHPMLRRLSLFLLVLASLVCANLASAKTFGGPKTRVRAIEVTAQTLISRTEQLREESLRRNRHAYGDASGNRLAAEGAGAGLADLATFRSELGLAEGQGTLARLSVGEQSFYWINAHGQELSIRVNAISATHAEADAFNQAFRSGVQGGEGTLVVDCALCPACGQNGAVRSMAQQLGLESLKVVTPGGVTVFTF